MKTPYPRLSSQVPKAKTTVTTVLAFVLVTVLIAMIVSPVYVGHPPSHRSMCLSNVKQIGIAAVIYQNDNDRLPSVIDWQARLVPYHKNPLIYRCPSLDNETRPVGFAMNRWLSRSSLSTDGLANTPIFFDTDDLVPNAMGTSVTGVSRHKDRANVAFGDGHAKSLAGPAASGLNCRPPTKKPSEKPWKKRQA